MRKGEGGRDATERLNMDNKNGGKREGEKKYFYGRALANYFKLYY